MGPNIVWLIDWVGLERKVRHLLTQNLKECLSRRLIAGHDDLVLL